MSSLIKKFRIKSFKEIKPVIELKDLTIAYGTRQIVENLNLNIQKTEICGLLGPNGAGKSSIYHSIIGLVKPSFGKIIIDGVDATDIPTHIRCSKFGISIIVSPSVFFLPLENSILQNSLNPYLMKLLQV